MENYKNDIKNSAIKVAYIGVGILVFLLFGMLFLVSSCSPKIVEKVRTEIQYRDRIVRDTAVVEIPVEVEKNVTRDTSSHLENSFATSDAMVLAGLLYHSLASKPQYIKVPVEDHVTDTIYKESEIRTEYVKVEKELNGWQKFRLGAFWWLILACSGLLVWIFRKPLLALIKTLL